MSAKPKDTLPYSVFGWGLVAAYAYFVAPEWLEFSLVGLALVLGAALGGTLAVYVVVVKLAAPRERPEVRELSWSAVALIAVGAALLVWVSAAAGGVAGRAAALTAPALGLLCAGIALWSLHRQPRDPAV